MGAAGPIPLTFKTIAVSGQSDIVAGNPQDTLTVEAGTDIVLATNAPQNKLTITTTAAAGRYVSPGCFPLTYVSTTTLRVGYSNQNGPASFCRDKDNTDYIGAGAGQPYLVDITVNGAANGDDSFQGAGTVAFNNATTVTGTSTTFKTSFGTRPCQGTVATTNGSPTVTGTGTFFLSEFAVNDLIEITSSGATYRAARRITAIASDTSLTTSTNWLNTESASTIQCIEQPTIDLQSDTSVGGTVHQVATITTDTAMVIETATAGGSLSGKNYWIGRRITRAAASAAFWLYVWIGDGSTGTTAFVSTQRATPFTITGYTDRVRRIGSLLLTSAGAITEFTQTELGAGARFMNLAIDQGVAPSRILSGGSATTWTNVTAANALVPPTSNLIYMSVLMVNSNAGAANTASVDARNVGTGRAAGSNIKAANAALSSRASSMVFCPCDGAQAIQYINTAATGATTLDVSGYVEVL